MAALQPPDAHRRLQKAAAGEPRLVYAPDRRPAERLDASIAISTRDRFDGLMVAVRSACAQQGCSCEVIVVDDGSRESLAEPIHQAFPSVSVYRSESPRDFVLQRNFIATVARGRVLVSIDDDAELVDPKTVAVTVRDFDAGRDIGAVAIPYRNLLPDGSWKTLQHPRGKEVECIASFIGTAYAVRRDLFLALGSFWEHRGHEERDFCLRMLQAGYLVRLGSAPALLHRPSAARNLHRVAFAHRRSDVQLVYRNVPAALLPWQLARTAANAILAAAVIGHGRYARDMARGYVAGLRAISRTSRRPVDRDVFRLHLRMRRGGPLPVDQARAALSRRPRGPL